MEDKLPKKAKKTDLRRATKSGTCPNLNGNRYGYSCGRNVLLRSDGRLRRHRTWDGYYCEDMPKREPRMPAEDSVRDLTPDELRDLREGTVQYVVRFPAH